MRFALVYSNAHQAYALHGLGRELSLLGHEVAIVPKWLNESAAIEANVIMGINQERTELIPHAVLHIAWIQDWILGAEKPYQANARPHDIIYTLGHGPTIGAPSDKWPNYRGSFTYGVDAGLLAEPMIEQDIDFSIVGYMPEPGQIWPHVRPVEGVEAMSPDVCRRILEICTANYTPLRGSLNQQRMVEAVDWGLEADFPDIWETLDKRHIGRFIHEWARGIDRWTVANGVLSVSANVELRGFNWEHWPDLAGWSKPWGHRLAVRKLFQRSRITVNNNVFGVAIQPRVLEAMALGCFVMSNKSPHGMQAGQMRETFTPFEDYGEYDGGNFLEEARYWLEEPGARLRAAFNARQVIRERHLWKHRAEQLLADLS